MKIIAAKIKANSDVYASSKEVAAKIARASEHGIPEWKIEPITLPILYGRSLFQRNDLPSTFLKIQEEKATKHTYVRKTLEESFDTRAKIIANNHANSLLV